MTGRLPTTLYPVCFFPLFRELVLQTNATRPIREHRGRALPKKNLDPLEHKKCALMGTEKHIAHCVNLHQQRYRPEVLPLHGIPPRAREPQGEFASR